MMLSASFTIIIDKISIPLPDRGGAGERSKRNDESKFNLSLLHIIAPPAPVFHTKMSTNLPISLN
jgi:hypothetical protein